ncbi:sigma-70 family RNA polymerase sigma factor [Rheinheimera sp. WS51]|uniref:sigma-70 family RNA polymerase sigma factor n=1 Tax=Rheinheimera sp. WS51 TaxID=3425886 RepID=UPI003D92DCC7
MMHTVFEKVQRRPVNYTSQPPVSGDFANMLLKIADQRCRHSFSILFNYYAPRLLSYGLRHLGNEQLAADLVQETMTNVWHKARLFNVEKGEPDMWIFTIARNIRYDVLRRNRHRQNDLSADDLWPILTEQGEMPESADTLENDILLQQLSRYCQLLPEAQRKVIEPLYIEGKSQQQVSDELGIPLGTVKSRTRLALIKLKELIDK